MILLGNYYERMILLWNYDSNMIILGNYYETMILLRNYEINFYYDSTMKLILSYEETNNKLSLD